MQFFPVLIFVWPLVRVVADSNIPCGIRPVYYEPVLLDRRSSPRIIGGNYVNKETTYPWYCSISSHGRTEYGKREGWLCGATLISQTELLTAAHCVSFLGTDWPKVYCGLGNRSFSIEDFIIHPKYTWSPTVQNDIAIVKLSSPIEFTSDIRPICIPKDDTILSEFSGVVVGRGMTDENVRIRDRVNWTLELEKPPKAAAIEYIPNKRCADTYRKYNCDKILDTHVCAGSVSKGTAQGDSGGPLMSIDHRGVWWLVGITSKGINNEDAYMNQEKYPGIYVRVAKYCEFIELNTNARCAEAVFCRSSYASLSLYLVIFVYMILYVCK